MLLRAIGIAAALALPTLSANEAAIAGGRYHGLHGGRSHGFHGHRSHRHSNFHHGHSRFHRPFWPGSRHLHFSDGHRYDYDYGYGYGLPPHRYLHYSDGHHPLIERRSWIGRHPYGHGGYDQRIYDATRDDRAGAYARPDYARTEHEYPRNGAGSGEGITPADAETLLEASFDLLAADRPSDALRLFAELARNDASDGRPKVGYALAAAQQHQYRIASWAMRRALRSDPPSLRTLPDHDSVEEVARELQQQFRDGVDGAGRTRADVRLLQAALHTILGEDELALAVLVELESAGVAGEAVDNLKDLLLSQDAPAEGAGESEKPAAEQESYQPQAPMEEQAEPEEPAPLRR